jgi:hypothetical protein
MKKAHCHQQAQAASWAPRSTFTSRYLLADLAAADDLAHFVIEQALRDRFLDFHDGGRKRFSNSPTLGAASSCHREALAAWWC